MHFAGRSNEAACSDPSAQLLDGGSKPFQFRRTLSLRAIRLYQICEGLTEGLIYFMVIFGPWAFGTTQRWSIWVMNIAGYMAGVLLFLKLFIRHCRGYRPGRWNNSTSPTRLLGANRAFSISKVWTRMLVCVCIMILGYCLIAALNARSYYVPLSASFDYRSYIKWLPHSYSGQHSWFAFWKYLGMALGFWSIHDWLLGQSIGEMRAARGANTEGRGFVQCPLPARLRRLLWLLSINGALVSLVGIIHRVSGSDKVLWLVKPRIWAGAFGPYNYQSNAAQYLNLVWPMSLGFWWTLRRGAAWGLRSPGNFGRWGYQLLLPCVMVTALGALLTNSRGGALVAATCIVAASVVLLVGRRREGGLVRLGVFLLCMATLLLGLWFGWQRLGPRMEQFHLALEARESMYKTARLMVQDCPWFGTGPGTFEPLFQLYRGSFDEYWPAQLHNDWLETRVTFGWLGTGLIVVALFVAVSRWFVGGAGIIVGWRFLMLFLVAIGGCLAHARFDFPFQVHSILFLFIVLCAILSVLTRRSPKGEDPPNQGTRASAV